MAITFFEEDITFKLPERNLHKKWLKEIAKSESFAISALNYIFCSDTYLLKINQEYLNHDTFTDIITFDTSEDDQVIEGDIFISIERVQENSRKEQVLFEEELHRVMSHGLLHLMGYKDKSKEDKIEMRSKEDHSVSLFHSVKSST
jgi:probable rRNA maturation factor